MLVLGIRAVLRGNGGITAYFGAVSTQGKTRNYFTTY